jgi:hypothetical protein
LLTHNLSNKNKSWIQQEIGTRVLPGIQQQAHVSLSIIHTTLDVHMIKADVHKIKDLLHCFVCIFPSITGILTPISTVPDVNVALNDSIAYHPGGTSPISYHPPIKLLI